MQVIVAHCYHGQKTSLVLGRKLFRFFCFFSSLREQRSYIAVSHLGLQYKTATLLTSKYFLSINSITHLFTGSFYL